MVFCSETLVSSMRHIPELMYPCFGSPMQPLMGEVNRFRGLAVNVHYGLGV